MLHDHVENLSSSQGAAVRYMLSTVSKATLPATLSSLEQSCHRSPAYGRFTVMCAVGSLLDNHSAERVTIAARLVSLALEKSNALTLVASALDEANTTVTKSSLTSLMTNDLKLTATQQMLFATSLTLGSATAKAAAMEFLQEFDVAQAAVSEGDTYARAVALLTRQVGTLQVLDVQLAPACGTLLLPPPQPQLSAHVSIGSVVRELGTGCVTTLADARRLLSIFPQPFTEKDLADVLGCFASYRGKTTDGSTYAALITASGKAPSKSIGTSSALANPLPVIEAMLETNKELDLDLAMKLLDQPGGDAFRINNLVRIFEAYERLSPKQEFPPVTLFLGCWKNVARQGALLEFIFRNPDSATYKTLEVESAAAALLPKEPVGRISEAARRMLSSFAYLESAVHVATHNKDFDNDVFRPCAEHLPLLFLHTMFFGTYPSTVKNFSTIKHILANFCPLLESIATHIIPEAVKRGRLDAVIGMFSELTVTFPNRILDVMEMVLGCQDKTVAQRFLQASGSPRLAVALAMCMDEAGLSSDKWLQTALEGKVGALSSCTQNRFSVAMGLVEVAEMLQKKQKYEASATAALNALMNSPVKGMLKSVTECARSMLALTESLFTEEVENEATSFFKKMYAEGSTVTAVATIQRLLKSTEERDSQLYACIVGILFEESTAISCYPRKELQLFAELYGQMIAKELLPANQQQRAWGILLPAIVRPANYATEEYGVIALEQIKPRLADWSQYGRALRHIKDLDFRVPGIMAAINRGIRQEEVSKNPESAQVESPNTARANALPVMDPAIVSAARAPDAQQLAKAHDAAKLHTVDITTLVTNKNVTAPPRVIQEQMNFLIGNTDIHKLDSNARELSQLLRPEYYEYFADYLVVKRAALEPNYHTMYLELVNKLQSKELDRTLRTATIAAVKRLLASEKIRTDTSERLLLRHLGMWLGAITLERNIPILQQDLSFKELLYTGLSEGKLIGVVSFMSRVLVSCANSQFFCYPNPWTMEQLCLLLEMYQLKHLKITLRFEVELLCSTLSITLAQLDEYSRAHHNTTPGLRTLEDVWKIVDLNESPDFIVGDGDGLPDTLVAPRGPSPNPDVPGAVGARASARPLQASAEPFQPKEVISAVNTLQALLNSLDMPVRPPIDINPDSVHVGEEEEKIVGAERMAEYRALVASALVDTVSAVYTNAANRHVTVATLTTLNLTLKDYARDPQPEGILLAAEAMSRSLASSLCFATAREAIREALGPTVAARVATHLQDKSVAEHELLAGCIVRNNAEFCVRALEYMSGEEAAKAVRTKLTDTIRDKATAFANNQPLPVPPSQKSAIELINVLGEPLVPSGRMPAPQREVYNDFFSCLPVVSLFQASLRSIEEAVTKYYGQESYTVCDISSQQFLENTNESQSIIRQRLTSILDFPRESAVYYVQPLFSKVMVLGANMDRLTKEQSINNKAATAANAAAAASSTPEAIAAAAAAMAAAENSTTVRSLHIATLLTQIYLCILRYCLDRGGEPVREEFTRHYLKHDQRYSFAKLTTDLIRVKVLNTARLDEDLARALSSDASSGCVSFAGDLINSIIIKDKLASSKKDLRHTLSALDIIARSRNAHRPPVPPSPAYVQTPPLIKSVDASVTQLVMPVTLPGDDAKKEQVRRLLNEWMNIWNRYRGHRHQGEERHPSVEYVKTLQQNGMLETANLSMFLGYSVQFCVEAYATASLALERENSAMAEATPIGKRPGAPPPYRTPQATHPFQRCDGFTDLVFVLLRCCSLRNESTWDQRAELTFLRRVLEMLMRVLAGHHDAIAERRTPEAVLPAGSAYMPVFQQQPYVRLLSNFITSIHRQETSAARDVSDSTTQTFQTILHRLQPAEYPAFAFGWVEIVAHRFFIPRCVRTPEMWGRYTELIIDAFRFTEYLTQNNSISPNGLVFYKALFKFMLILLHDYPQFLIDQYFPLVDAIPWYCFQMRNTVLCSFPPDLRLPEPFARVPSDMPEMQRPIDTKVQLATIAKTFGEYAKNNVIDLAPLDRYLGRDDEPMPEAAMKPYLDILARQTRWSLVNAFVLHVALKYLETHNNTIGPDFAYRSNAMRFYRYLCRNFTTQLRYHFLCACASHLRYPNIQTNFFGKVIFGLFMPDSSVDGRTQTAFQEQITRVVAERTMVIQPHPWGVLNAFVEIMRNPEFEFWTKSFAHAPQLDNLFSKLRRTVDVKNGSAQQQQQQMMMRQQQQQQQQQQGGVGRSGGY